MWAVILLAVLVPIIPLLTCGGCVVMSMISAAVDDGAGGSGDQEQPSEEQPEPEPFDTEATVAWIMAKRFVKDSLKSPSTASFGNQVCNDDTVTRTGPHSFEVRGWVDAQNSFGATLRNRFHVKLHCDDSSYRWELDEPVVLIEP